MGVDPLLQMVRRDEADTFDSSCRITEPGEGFHDADGVWHPPAANTVYTGPCSFLPTETMVRTVDVAGAQLELYPYAVKVPASTPVKEDHVVEITACPDPAALGFYTVRTVPASQWQVNRVVGVEQGVS